MFPQPEGVIVATFGAAGFFTLKPEADWRVGEYGLFRRTAMLGRIDQC
jgi:hypothetical protein